MAELDLDQLRIERDKRSVPVGMTDFESSASVLKQVISPWLTERLKQISDDPATKEILTSIQESNPTLSRPRRCAIYLGNYESNELYKQSQVELEEGSIGNFTIFYDLAYRVEDAAISIERAEGVFARGAEQEALRAFSYYIRKPEVTADQAKMKLEGAAAKFQRYSELIQGNQSGLHVMHYQAVHTLQGLYGFPEHLAEPSLSGYGLAVELLGEIYAAELYRVIYPLSQ